MINITIKFGGNKEYFRYNNFMLQNLRLLNYIGFCSVLSCFGKFSCEATKFIISTEPLYRWQKVEELKYNSGKNTCLQESMEVEVEQER